MGATDRRQGLKREEISDMDELSLHEKKNPAEAGSGSGGV